MAKLSEGFIDFGADFRFSLTSAYALWNGTNIPLTLVYETDKN